MKIIGAIIASVLLIPAFFALFMLVQVLIRPPTPESLHQAAENLRQSQENLNAAKAEFRKAWDNKQITR